MDLAHSATGKATYFNRTFDETMDLLVEARNYVAADASRGYNLGEASKQLVICCEAFRVTSRLTHVMAWLLARRAVHEGEITREESATETFQLGGRTTCLEENLQMAAVCDDHLSTLLDRSLRLYIRIARLDDMVQQSVVSPYYAAGLKSGPH